MPTVSMFDKTYEILEKTLDVTQKRHSLISSNIANVDTTGYRAKDIPFDETLRKEIRKTKIETICTHPRHIGNSLLKSINYEIREEEISGVDIDKEMARLSENNIRYQTGIELLLRKFNLLKHAISEGGR